MFCSQKQRKFLAGGCVHERVLNVQVISETCSTAAVCGHPTTPGNVS